MSKVSILMPIFNEEAFLKESIESVLEQSYKNIELIIIDDFSTDKSYSLAEQYSLKNSRIRLIRNLKKGKVSAFVFVINLFDLGGSDNLVKNNYKVENLIEFPGH